MCKLNLKPENLENPMEQYTSTLHNISEKKLFRKPLWIQKDSTNLGGMKNAKMAFVLEEKYWQDLKKTTTLYHLDNVRARRVFKESMKTSWQNYVSKLNSSKGLVKDNGKE